MNLAKDPTFTRFSDEERHAYLTDTDVSYRGATPDEQRAYLAYLRPTPEAQRPKPGWFARGARPLTRGVSDVISTLALGGIVDPQTVTGMAPGVQQGADVVAKTLVPQTATEAGMMLGTGGAGKLATSALKGASFAQRARRGGTRIAGATMGGAVGGTTEDVGAVGGAARGALAGTLGESAGVLGGIAQRRLPGGKERMARQYQKDIGGAIRAIIPEVGTLETGRDFAQFARLAQDVHIPGARGAATTLGDMLDTAAAEINAHMAGRTLNVPSAMTIRNARGQPIGGVQVRGTAALTFDQAVGQLRRFYRQAWTAEQARQGEQAFRAREKAGRLFGEMEAELLRQGKRIGVGAYLAETFRQSQQKYAMGLELSKEVGRALKLNQEGSRLDEPALQQVAFDRLRQATRTFKRNLGDLDTWWRSVYQGDEFAKSRIPAGPGSVVGSMLEPYRMIGEQRGGSAALAGALPRSLIPGISAQYVGAPRLNPRDETRLLLDLLAGKGLTRPAEAE